MVATLGPLQYTEWGLAVLPLCWPDADRCACGRSHKGRDVAKAPLTARGDKDASTDTAVVGRWMQLYPRANYGAAISASRLIVVDTDSEEAEAEAQALGVPRTYTVQSGGGEGHIHRYYRRPDTCPLARTTHQGESGHIDVLAAGYVVLPPSLHASGRRYEWLVSPDDEGAQLAEAPTWAVRLLYQQHFRVSALSNDAFDLLSGLKAISDDDTGELDRSGTLFAIAAELHRAGCPAAKVPDLLADRDAVLGRHWQKGPKFVGRGDADARYAQTAEAAQERVDREPKLVLGKGKSGLGAAKTPPRQILYASIDLTEDRRNAILSAPLSDAGNVSIMQLLFGDDITYDPVKGRWLRWGDHTWTETRKEYVEGLAIRVTEARLAAVQAAGSALPDTVARAHRQWAERSQNNFQMQGTVAVARAMMGEERPWDEDDFLLGCANGVVDLRSGVYRAGKREDWISLNTGVAYDPLAACARWERFVLEVLGGDQILADWLQKAVGYTLTGSTQEECLMLMHGKGANGKSTFTHILRAIMGGYAQDAPFATFEDSGKGDNGPTNDLAMLASRRLVTASEAQEGRTLNEARVKRATGRSPITCRFLNKEFFTYLPKFKLWLEANHLPLIRGRDDGIWRRFRMVPFLVSFLGREDHQLRAALETEIPGVLRWAVEGAVAWATEGGLRPDQCPDAVVTATKEYRQEMDLLAPFLDDCCAVATETAQAKGMFTEGGRLYHAYRMWVKEQGYPELKRRAFTDQLQERGIDLARTASVRGFQGVLLNETGDGYASRVF